MVRWNKNDQKKQTVSKEKLQKALLKTTLKNYNKVLLLESNMYTNGETFY